MKLKPLMLMTLSLVVIFISCEMPNRIYGSQNTETRVINVNDDFSSVSIDSVCSAIISKGDSFSIEVTANDNIFDYVDIRTVSGVLFVDLEDSFQYDNITYQVRITMPDINAVTVQGVSSCRLVDFDLAHSFNINIDGVSSISAVDSSVNGFLTLDVDGTSSAALDDLPVTGNSRVTIDGVSSGSVNVSGVISGYVDGVSSLRYTNADLSSNFSVGSITCSVTRY